MTMGSYGNLFLKAIAILRTIEIVISIAWTLEVKHMP
jgi:hypothetical protein